MPLRSSLALGLFTLCACRTPPLAPSTDAAIEVARLDLSDAQVTYRPRWRRTRLPLVRCAQCPLWPTDPSRTLFYRSSEDTLHRLVFEGPEHARTASMRFFDLFSYDSATRLRFVNGRTILERGTIADKVKGRLVLLERNMTPGARWRSDFSLGYFIDATVVRRETVTVPAGTFDALLVRYARVGSPSEVSMLWFVEGVGIVRAVREDPTYCATYELEAAVSAGPPDLSIDGSARPPGALRAELRVLAPAVVGERLPFQLLVFNDSPTPIAILPIRNGAGYSEPHQHHAPPTVSIELEGGPVKYRRGYRECGLVFTWSPAWFETVAPGEARDLSTHGHDENEHLLTEHTPASPGRYRARFVYNLWTDQSWAARESPDVRALVRSLPRGRFVSQWVTFDVLPPRKLEALDGSAAGDTGAEQPEIDPVDADEAR